jgi:hypothetical protein
VGAQKWRKHLISWPFLIRYFSSLQGHLQMPIGALMKGDGRCRRQKKSPRAGVPWGKSRTPELLSNLLALRREVRQCAFIVAGERLFDEIAKSKVNIVARRKIVPQVLTRFTQRLLV